MSERAKERIHRSALQAQEAAFRIAWQTEFDTRMGKEEDQLQTVKQDLNRAKAQAALASKKAKLKPGEIHEVKLAVLQELKARFEGELLWEQAQLAIKQQAKLGELEKPAIPDETHDGRVIFITIADHKENIESYEMGIELTREWLAPLEAKTATNGDKPKK